jgi:DNA-binding IclR family transcriptional regulator
MQTDLPPDARRLVRSAFERYPEDGWIRERLAAELGLPVSTVEAVLTDLSDAGLVLLVDDEYISALQID